MPYNGSAWDAMQAKLDAKASSPGSESANSNMEQSFKDSLQQHQYPYNPSAWTAMKSKLDVAKPVAPKSNFRYYAAAVGITAIAVASYFVWKSNETPANNNNQESELVESDASNKSTTKTTYTSQHANTVDADGVHEELNHSQNAVSEGGSSMDNSPESAPEAAVNEFDEITREPIVIPEIGTPAPVEIIDIVLEDVVGEHPEMHINENDENLTSPDKMRMPFVPNQLCLNDNITLENKNNRYIVIQDSHGDNFTVAPGEKRTFNAAYAGKFILGFYADNAFNETKAFNVQKAPQVEMLLDDDIKYVNGLPTTKVNVSGNAESVVWTSGRQAYTSNDADFHFYKQGNHTITLTASNGVCKTQVSETVYTERYNLLAVTGFNPYDSDPRNNTFIPFALTERNTNFHMIIVDPRNGEVVYETNDANRPWDGTDMRTGKIDSDVATYIWKVTLENPEPGEPAEYKGTITKL